jgi:hypothetical protein
MGYGRLPEYDYNAHYQGQMGFVWLIIKRSQVQIPLNPVKVKIFLRSLIEGTVTALRSYRPEIGERRKTG